MNVLLLSGNGAGELAAELTARGERVSVSDSPVTPALLAELQTEFIVSYNYRHLITPEVIDCFPGRIVNLHISWLPWNRGADPNFWSVIDGTPRGVTVHHVDAHLDTGDIIAREEIGFAETETMAETYAELNRRVRELFLRVWPALRAGTAPRQRQKAGGSCHRRAEFAALAHLLEPEGWNLTAAELRRRYAVHRSGGTT
jgi:methionyl-tRNA formyltransferase